MTTSSQCSSAPGDRRPGSASPPARRRHGCAPPPGWRSTGDVNRKPGQRRSATSALQPLDGDALGLARRRHVLQLVDGRRGRRSRSGRAAGVPAVHLELAPAVVGGHRQPHVGGGRCSRSGRCARTPWDAPRTCPNSNWSIRTTFRSGGRRPPGGGEAHRPATDDDEVGGPVPHLRGERTAPVRRRYRSRGSCGSRARTSGSRAGRSSSCGPRRGRRRCAACACGRTSRPAGSTG